ncbi:MAG: RDD family protein [Prevotella sp.]|nr:RDD family protein [Prevotella sp.]
MADKNIVTGQYVRIAQTPASIWERIVARIIDYVIVFIYLIGYFYLLANLDYSFSSNMEIVFGFILFLPVLLYDFLWETFNNGRSPGKFLLGMRVVKADGSMPGMGAYLMRWLFSLVEGPMMGGIGLLPMLLSEQTQRFGDLAAGTMVIKKAKYHALEVSLEEYNYLTPNYRPSFPQAADLSERQVEVIDNTLSSFSSDRMERISLLAVKVKQVLGIDIPTNDERFLYTVLHDYYYYDMTESV